MAITNTFWAGSRADDLHVVTGAKTMDLRTLLAVQDSVVGAKFANALPAGVTVKFIPRFTTAVVAGNVVGNFGVQVDTTSGIVEGVGAPRIRSFLLEAEITDTNVVPAKKFSTFIRVSTHAGIQRIWLTPAPIHLRQSANGQKLTVMAEFTDGRMGMVNSIPGLAWTTSAAAVVNVGASSGELSIITMAGSADITVTLPVSYQVGPVSAAPSATAKVFCQAPWNTPLRAKLVPGSAGYARRNDVRNIVMLSEGFVAGEQPKFEQAARSFVDFMRNDISALPFGLCSASMNFWTVWIPSTEAGTATLNPALPLSGDRSEPLPDAAATSAPASPKTLEELLERVGFATTADLARNVTTQKAEWVALYGAGFDTNITNGIYNSWRRLASLRQIDERDTAFGIATGGWPNAAEPTVARSHSFHPFRTTRDHIDPLLAALLDDASGSALGNLWGTGSVNRAHVLLVCNGGRSGGALSPGPAVVALALETDENVRIDKTGPGMRTKLKPFGFPRTVSLRARSRFVHESAHSFNLDDEYGGGPNFPASMATVVQPILNQQPVTATATPGLAGIDPAKLKWNLPRIEKAAVLVSAPTVNVISGEVEIIVGSTQATAFAVGDVLRLRQRPLNPASKVSGEITLTVMPVSVAAGDKMKLRGALGAVNPADFGKGSIAFVEKKNGAAVVKLIHDDIATHIRTTGVALNTTFGTTAAGYVCVPKTTPDWASHWTVQPARNIPEDPAHPGSARKPYRPKYTAFIVGAYEGGTGYHCGILHPTGACVMRQLEIGAAAAGAAYDFCAVCAYVLVDALDPTMHGVLDLKFIDDRHYRAVR